MKMTFRGWGREIYQHKRDVSPVTVVSNKYKAASADEPLVWSNSLKAFGKVSNLGLTGDFLVEFNFKPEELRGWLQEYVKAEPETALRLLAELQAEAMIALARKPQELKEKEEEEDSVVYVLDE